jgi:hypothetical protein
MSQKLARRSSENGSQKILLEGPDARDGPVVATCDFVEVFENHGPTGSIKRRAGPAGAANSAVCARPSEQDEKP